MVRSMGTPTPAAGLTRDVMGCVRGLPRASLCLAKSQSDYLNWEDGSPLITSHDEETGRGEEGRHKLRQTMLTGLVPINDISPIYHMSDCE